MSRRMIHLTLMSATCIVFATASGAFAQFGLFGNNNCCNPCAQPVVQNVYRTVPVTEFKPVVETVRKPVVETKYVEEPITEYRPVTRQRTVEVPQVTYHNVTENRTAYRNAGYWQTERRCRTKISPCAYDGRPNFLGWLSRSAYSARQSFTPNYTTHRKYVPRTVAYNVPVTRQVASRSTRKVTYNYTEMVAHRTTRRVAVNTVRYVDTKVTVMRPTTVMRTVPIGTSVAYGYPGAGTTTAYGYGFPAATTTALAPTPDSLNRSRGRTARKDDGRYERSTRRDDDEEFNSKKSPFSAKKSSFIIKKRRAYRDAPQAYKSSIRNRSVKLASHSRGGWKARKSSTDSSTGPALVNLKVADNN